MCSSDLARLPGTGTGTGTGIDVPTKPGDVPNKPDKPKIDVDGQPTDAQIMASIRPKRQNFGDTIVKSDEIFPNAKKTDLDNMKKNDDIINTYNENLKDIEMRSFIKRNPNKYSHLFGGKTDITDADIDGVLKKLGGKVTDLRARSYLSRITDMCMKNYKTCGVMMASVAAATTLGIYIRANNNYEKCKRVEEEAKKYNVKYDNLKCEEEYNEQAIEECKKKIEKKKNLKSSPNNKENVASENNLLKCDDGEACGIRGLIDEKCDEYLLNNCQNYIMAIDDTKKNCIELKDGEKMNDILKELNNAGIYPGPLWIKDPETNELSGPKWTGGDNWDKNDEYSKQLFNKYIVDKEHCWVKIADIITTTDYETGETITEIVEPAICNEICRKIFDNNIDLKMGKKTIDFLAHIAKEYGYIIKRIVGLIILYFVLYIGYYIFIGGGNMYNYSYNYPYKRY